MNLGGPGEKNTQPDEFHACIENKVKTKKGNTERAPESCRSSRDSSGDSGRCLVVGPFRGGSGSFRSVRFRTALEINAVFF